MFQFAFVAVLFQFRARKPQFSPLLQFPNRRQTPQVAPSLCPYILFYNLRCFKAPVSSGGVLRAPRPPENGDADRWQQKIGGADAPVRSRGCAVPNPRPQAASQPTAAIPEP